MDNARKRREKRNTTQRLIARSRRLNGEARRPATQISQLLKAATANGLARKLIRWPHKLTLNELIQINDYTQSQRGFEYSPGILLQHVSATVYRAFLVYHAIKTDSVQEQLR
jgi:hypothetical protein